MTTASCTISLDGLEKCLSPDKVTIDNLLFRLHHKVSFGILVVGFIFTFIENHFYTKAITCHGAHNDEYTNFCWLHGSGYMGARDVTHCVVDQAEFHDQEDNANINYYLWIPLLLLGLLCLSKLPRRIWRSFEGGLMEALIKAEDNEKTGAKFLKKTYFSFQYHVRFFLCEVLNLLVVVVSMWICNCLFNDKFWNYGTKVFEFREMSSAHVKELRIPDPKCDVFPTEVSCRVNKEKNLFCVLSNNIFNQHYFFILWIWWIILLVASVICLIFRISRIVMPRFSKFVFGLRHSKLSIIKNINGLSGADFFVLDLMAENLGREELENLLLFIEESSEENRVAIDQVELDRLMEVETIQ